MFSKIVWNHISGGFFFFRVGPIEPIFFQYSKQTLDLSLFVNLEHSLHSHRHCDLIKSAYS